MSNTFRLQMLHANYADFLASNPVLEVAEPSISNDAEPGTIYRVLKVGDGVTAWADLPAIYVGLAPVEGPAADVSIIYRTVEDFYAALAALIGSDDGDVISAGGRFYIRDAADASITEAPGWRLLPEPTGGAVPADVDVVFTLATVGVSILRRAIVESTNGDLMYNGTLGPRTPISSAETTTDGLIGLGLTRVTSSLSDASVTPRIAAEGMEVAPSELIEASDGGLFLNNSQFPKTLSASDISVSGLTALGLRFVGYVDPVDPSAIGSSLYSAESAAAARTVLGLGSAATRSVGDLEGNLVALDVTGKFPLTHIPTVGLLPIGYGSFNGEGVISAVNTAGVGVTITRLAAGDYQIVLSASSPGYIVLGSGGIIGRAACQTVRMDDTTFRLFFNNHGNAIGQDVAYASYLIFP